MENYGLIRHGHYQEDYMGDKIVPPVVRQDQFDEEVSHENNAYPELPLLKARLHVELDSVESVDRDHDNQQNRQQENDDVKDDEDSLFAEKLIKLSCIRHVTDVFGSGTGGVSFHDPARL